MVWTSGHRLKALRQKQGAQLAEIQIQGIGVFHKGCQGGKWQQETLLSQTPLPISGNFNDPADHSSNPFPVP